VTDRDPLVSILTPSFNQGRWLADNLQSVRAQTYPEIEHVVMDGGSTDGTLSMLNGADDIRWTSEPDNGQTDALNKAFAQSTGSIIGWINSDDAYYSPTVVAEVVDSFRRYPDVAVVYGHAALVNADSLVLHALWVPDFDPELLDTFNYVIQPAAFFRREAVDGRFLDDRFESAMDREFWLRLARGGRFVRLDRILAIDRHQPDRKVYTRPDLAQADLALLVREYGVDAAPSGDPRFKALKICHRLAGLTLVPELLETPLAFPGRRDGALTTTMRQAFLPRRFMQIDGNSGAGEAA